MNTPKEKMRHEYEQTTPKGRNKMAKESERKCLAKLKSYHFLPPQLAKKKL